MAVSANGPLGKKNPFLANATLPRFPCNTGTLRKRAVIVNCALQSIRAGLQSPQRNAPDPFRGSAVVPAREAGGRYEPPANRRGNNNAARPDNNPNRPPNPGGNANRPPFAHAKEITPHDPPAPPNTGNPKLHQKYGQQQDRLYSKQATEHQKLQQKQEQDHQRLAQQNANEARRQQVEQRHQQQTQQMEQRHTQQQQRTQERQQPPRQNPPPKPPKEKP